jgi:hypothetical protein
LFRAGNVKLAACKYGLRIRADRMSCLSWKEVLLSHGLSVQVHLDKTVTLLDSPGIVFSAAGGSAAAALRNCAKVRISLSYILALRASTSFAA